MIRTCRCRNDLCRMVSDKHGTWSEEHDEPGGKVKDIQKGSKGITRDISNLSLVHQSLVEEVCGVLLLNLFLTLFLVTLGAFRLFFLHGQARDVETHLNQLIRTRRGLATPVLRASRRLPVGAVCLSCGERKLHRHFVLSGQVGVGNFGVGDLEGGSVLHVERQFGLGELCFAPVPASQGVFAILDVDPVPDFEGLAQPLQVLVMIFVSCLM